MSETPPAPKPRLRRRLRAPLLRATAGLAGLAPESWLRAGIGTLAGPATRTSVGKRTRANLELALGAELDAAQRARLTHAALRHSARLFAEWTRLAKGATGPRGQWIDERVVIDDSVVRSPATSGTSGRRGCVAVPVRTASGRSCITFCLLRLSTAVTRTW